MKNVNRSEKEDKDILKEKHRRKYIEQNQWRIYIERKKNEGNNSKEKIRYIKSIETQQRKYIEEKHWRIWIEGKIIWNVIKGKNKIKVNRMKNNE